MERYHIYKLGIAILFYAVYCRRPMLVNGSKVDDVIGTVNTTQKISAREYFVYYQGVQGRPGIDFPVFSRIPRTTFSCKEVESGYYADLETDCQVFHICNEGTKVSFLCPNGTIFQQSDLICDWWFKVNCTNSPQLYEESAEQLRESYIRRKASRRVLPHSNEEPRKSNRPHAYSNVVDRADAPKTHVFVAEEKDEAQITQESGSFVQNYNNKYPNHRTTYSDVQDPQKYYTTAAMPNALNNGKPFVVSTPKFGNTKSTTPRASFKYSPTVPTVKPSKSSYVTPMPSASSTTKKYMSTYGERIRQANAVKSYSNVESFTHPPTVSNGQTTPVLSGSRKSKAKNSFTIGLNSVQGSVNIKNATQNLASKKPETKNKNTIKFSLSSNEGSKVVNPKPRNKIRLDLGDVEVPTLKLSLENEIPPPVPQNPTTLQPNGFFVTRSGNTVRPGQVSTNQFNAGSITGSKNTYIPTTTSAPTYFPNHFYARTTSIPKPKPFQLPPDYVAKTTPRLQNFEFFETTSEPNYQISSASPFTNVPPTLPTTYQAYGTTTVQPLYSQHIGGMLQTLQQLANVRVAKKEEFDDKSRPGLVVPPSVGPQTLHTLAVYFANALDNLVAENLTNIQEELTTTEKSQDKNVLNSLLSMDTLQKYKDLFRAMNLNQEADDEESTTKADDNDLEVQHSNNAVQSPRIRQLAKVFSQALSSYLDDPETFKRVLQEIRPTEPPPLNTLPTSESTQNQEEDELLNFSDADIKPENPRLPTPAPANPTWGYILAYNTSDSKNNDFKTNHIDQTDENLQSADSQSFVNGFNEINSNRLDKSLKNHWTSSPEVTKLWQTTLYVNPVAVNQKFITTEPLINTSTEEAEEFEDDSTKPSAEEENTTIDLTEYVTENVVDYELRSLPKLNLNATSVHGILIDFMNATNQEDGKLQRILRKLNTTQDEFLNKMKQIEQNPITRRLILLLVSECGNHTITQSHAVRDIINLANSGGNREQRLENLQTSSSATAFNRFNDRNHERGRKAPENSSLKKYVDPNLQEDDHDSRALQLLNSLYNIASKYGK